MEVCHPIAVPFETLAHRRFNWRRLGNSIDQHAGAGAQQTPRPACDYSRAGKSNQRVHELPAERPGERQTSDCQQGRGRVGQDVNVSGAQIQVVRVTVVTQLGNEVICSWSMVSGTSFIGLP